MKRSITHALFICGFLIGTTLVTSCGSKAKQEQSEEHAATKSDSTQTVYACSMHPEVTGKEGDKCSKCGMALEAVKKTDSVAAEHHH
jgi:hypothetical protein